MAQVELTGLSKIFPGGIEAVKDVDLTVEDGEFLVLVGPSGCGKSTTLRMIAGLEEASAGEIRIGGRRVNDIAPKDRDIAMVFQNYALYPHMTVYKNMAFGLSMRRLPKKEIEERVRRAAAILGIEDLLNRKPKALSGGQRQRVAVGRAIVRDPQVFLFDEPLSNLDAMLRVQMRMELRKLHARLGATTIYVTHDQVEAMTMGNRIVVMLEGAIQQAAAPAEVYRNPANRFVAGFIGTPPMNFIDGIIKADDDTLFFQDHSAQFRLHVDSAHREALHPYTDRNVVLGIRPEDIVDTPDQTPVPGKNVVARIEVVEPLGAETHLHLSVDGHALIARMDGTTRLEVGTERVLEVVASRVHYFDDATDRSILRK